MPASRRRLPSLVLLALLSSSTNACFGCLAGKAEVVGKVFDSAGPVAEVKVSGGSGDTTTDATGLFRVKVRRGGSLLRFEKTGYAPAYRPVAPGGADWQSVLVELAAQEHFDLDPAQGDAKISLGTFGEVTISLPAGSVDTQAPYEALVAYYPVVSGLQTPPVPLLGVEGQEQLALESFGMLDLTLLCGGKPCKLAKNATLSLRLPTLGGDPDSATLFSADPKQGLWVQEGTATNTGASWSAELTHLSWWNIDAFLKVPAAERACLRVVTQGPSGRPLPGAKIIGGWGMNLRRSIRGHSESDGALCSESFPSKSEVTLAASHFLQPGASAIVSASLTLTPSAGGASCESDACQELLLTLACTKQEECGPGFKCASGECVEDKGPGTLKLSFVNEDSAQPVHLWGPEETIDPSNRVEPGKSTRRSFEVAPGDTPLFHAGREGQTLASLACLAIEIPNKKAQLIWDGSALRCVGF